MIKEKDLFCSFCGKTNEVVKLLIAGPNGIFICNECIEICNDILKENYKKEDKKQKIECSKEVLLLTRKKLLEMNKSIKDFLKELDSELENKE